MRGQVKQHMHFETLKCRSFYRSFSNLAQPFTFVLTLRRWLPAVIGMTLSWSEACSLCIRLARMWWKNRVQTFLNHIVCRSSVKVFSFFMNLEFLFGWCFVSCWVSQYNNIIYLSLLTMWHFFLLSIPGNTGMQSIARFSTGIIRKINFLLPSSTASWRIANFATARQPIDVT